MYVSTVNCPKYDPYGAMMATKRQFGKLGGNVAYHGFQSFKPGEVTPEEAHAIGMETAKKMWGAEYQIVVTTHLNTDSLHNHFVINSVSFKTGRKFENHVSDHYKLREISDAICREYNKSVLENASFYGGEKGAYWAHREGKLTHRDILRRDVDEAISKTTTYNSFAQYLRNLGYEFRRDANGNNPSLIAKGWNRLVRLKSIGPRYTMDAIRDRLLANHSKPELYVIVYPQRKRTPLLAIEYAYREAQRMDGLQLMFAVFIELLKLCTDNSIEERQNRPLSPLLREEVRKLDKYIEDYELLCDCHIDTTEELSAFRTNITGQIAALKADRDRIRNRIRRAPEEEKADLKKQAKAVTERLTPLRKQLKQADRIMARSSTIHALLDQERQIEKEAMNIRERSYAR